MADLQLIPAGHGAGLRLQRGEQLRLIDPHGGQSGDLLAFSQDGAQRLSNGRTFDYSARLRDALMSLVSRSAVGVPEEHARSRSG